MVPSEACAVLGLASGVPVQQNLIKEVGTAVTGDPKRGCSFDRGGPFDVPGRTSVCGQFSWIENKKQSWKNTLLKKNLFLEIENSIFRHLKIDF